MKTIVLISCVAKKKTQKAKAEELYESPLFVKSLAYAKTLTPNNRFHENENPVPFNKPPNKPIVSIVRKGVLSISTPF